MDRHYFPTVHPGEPAVRQALNTSSVFAASAARQWHSGNAHNDADPISHRHSLRSSAIVAGRGFFPPSPD